MYIVVMENTFFGPFENKDRAREYAMACHRYYPEVSVSIKPIKEPYHKTSPDQSLILV